jgi:prefoldin beta subunit
VAGVANSDNKLLAHLDQHFTVPQDALVTESLSSTCDARMSSDNMGANMAAAVDAELAKFRSLQEEMAEKHQTLQQLLAQQNENEMVQQELLLLKDDDRVYKMVGPVLLKNDLDDAKLTVSKRLEFINGEIKKVENSIQELEKKANEVAKKANEMQGLMQQAAVEATKAIAAQHARG